MKYFFTLIFTVFCVSFSNAQSISEYIFSSATGSTLDAMTGSTQLIGSNQDDVASAVTPIGFTFSFAGTAYTQFSASSNGLLRLGDVPVSDTWENTAPNVAQSSPAIMPYWDDLATGTTGKVHYLLTGTSPNRILKIEWFVTIPHNAANPASGKFQCLLYETTNEVKFLYGQGMVSNSNGYSLGIAISPTIYSTIQVSLNLAYSTFFLDNDYAISSGRSYSFLPPPICIGTPAAGLAASSVSNACIFIPFNLSLSGVVLSSSNSYQWQSSPAGANTFTNLGTSQSVWGYSISSQTSATDYRVITTCMVSGLFATSSIISVGQNSFINCYCIPSITARDPADIITNVTTGTLNNTSTYTAPSYYSIYNNIPVNMQKLTIQNISITGGSGAGNYSAVWIDYNQNGGFEALENVALATTAHGANATVNYSFAIPANATLGQTRMRVRVGYGSLFTASDACASRSYGETEDYLVNIVAAPSCVPLVGLTNTIVNSNTVGHTWSLQGAAPTLGYEYSLTTSTTPPATGTVSSVPSGVTTGLTAGSTYYLHARGNCGAGDFSIWVTSAPIRLIHCSPAPTSVDGLGITNVSFGTINNTTLAELNNYGNYSSQISVHQRGSIELVSITYKTGYTYDTKIYIDYNDDYDFNDVGEEVYSGVSLATNPTTLLASITIPSTAPLGRHRLRIGGLDDGPVSPCYTGSYGSFEDYTIEIETATICSGTPANAAITASLTLGCTVLNTLLTATTTSQGSGKTYQWQSSITGANNFVNISGATSSTYAVSTTTSRDYKVIITCSGNSASSAAFPVTVLYPAANDNICDAIPLTLNAASVCGNTFCATVLNTDPPFTYNTTNNTVWYSFTPATTAMFAVTLSRPVGASTNFLNGYLGLYSATGSCPSALSLTAVTTSASLIFQLQFDSLVELATPILTAGTKYYFMIDGRNGDSGVFCIRVNPIPIPPLCTTNISPANNATNVPLIPYITLTWNAVPGASSYDVYYDEVNPPTYLGVTADNFIEIVGSLHSSPYYWYVVPKNVGGAAIGCATNISTFTSSSVCEPYYGVNCTFGINLEDVVLKGEGTSAISIIGTTCESVNQFTDLTASTTVNLAIGKAYTGNFKTNTLKGYLSIWIDFNNNNIFEPNERLLNNLVAKAVGASTDYSILIPTSATIGVRKMRVREVFYNSAPALPTDPCNPYSYGEAKDFSVNIVASGAAYSVSNVGAGACVEVAKATIDSASNNNAVSVPILDNTGAIVAAVNANGNNLKTITTSLYRNTGAIRQDASGKKYMDRNISITPDAQPTTGNVAVRLYFTAAELAALQSADPTVTNVSSLNVTKTSAACAAVFAPASSVLLPQSGNGLLGTNYFMNINTPTFSSFFIAGGNTVLPISILYINGIKKDKTHQLSWKMNCTVTPFVKMILERSSDGNRFTSIYEETATAARCLQPFNYDDVQPLVNRNYYRIKSIDIDGKILYSSIVTLLNNDGGFELISVTPNPVKNNAVLIISSGKAGKTVLHLSDISGKVLAAKTIQINAGNNTIGLDTENLTAGSYIISVKNDKNESRNMKFVKY